jgi:hypothetical protein
MVTLSNARRIIAAAEQIDADASRHNQKVLARFDETDPEWHPGLHGLAHVAKNSSRSDQPQSDILRPPEILDKRFTRNPPTGPGERH